VFQEAKSIENKTRREESPRLIPETCKNGELQKIFPTNMQLLNRIPDASVLLTKRLLRKFANLL
jgi:hypothetical protein